MKALSVRQPWCELIARGDKTIEVRTWRTHYRGELLIVAGSARHALGNRLHGRLGETGVSACIVELVDVRPLTPDDLRAAGLDGVSFDEASASGRAFAWVLRNARRVRAVPMLGQLSLFTPPVVPPLL